LILKKVHDHHLVTRRPMNACQKPCWWNGLTKSAAIRVECASEAGPGSLAAKNVRPPASCSMWAVVGSEPASA